jgi:hypothetical protein
VLELVTINDEDENSELPLEILYDAFDYFPSGIWAEIKFHGNINMDSDLEISVREEVYGAFLFNSLIVKVRELKKMLRVGELLLALTNDPVIFIYHQFVSRGIKNITGIVRDYVSKDVGVVSLFEMDEEAATRIAAHGLGHNRGLIHHDEPLDLMYVGLLNGIKVDKNGFCDDCERKLEKTIV